MKKLIITSLILLPFVSMAQEKYTLTGEVADTANNNMVYMRHTINSILVTDSARVRKGKFILTGNLPSVTEGNLFLEHSNRSTDLLAVYLEPKVMSIKSSTKMIKNGVVSGSGLNDMNQLYIAELKPLELKNQELIKEWQSRIKAKTLDSAYNRSFNEQNLAIHKETQKVKRKFYNSHLDSYVGLVAFLTSGSYDISMDLEGTASEFSKFSKNVRSTALGKSIDRTIQGAIKTKVGMKAIEFTQNDVNGRPVKLVDFKGKYVLLDFWASWCAPCRAENPVLVKAFAKYKDRNFIILSVSLDQPGKKQSWLDAIKKDEMTWTNVSDLKYWHNEVALKYGISTVPANFLIDPNGKIIARDLRGEELEKTLAALNI